MAHFFWVNFMFTRNGKDFTITSCFCTNDYSATIQVIETDRAQEGPGSVFGTISSVSIQFCDLPGVILELEKILAGDQS